MIVKLSKVVLICAIAFHAMLVFINNITDYDSNYQYVIHVLSMDTTFPNNQLMWRAIESPLVYHLAYAFIIALEGLVSLLCWIGGLQMLFNINNAKKFNAHKGFAVAGLTLGIVLWFTGFITIGGEWFLMWQSEKWDGINASFRIVAIFALTLIYLMTDEREVT